MPIVLFWNVFYECIEGKLGICLLLAMSIDGDWMVNMMIIYIKKTIAKVLDVNDIIKFFMGMSAWWVQTSINIKFNHLLKFENKYTFDISILWGQPPIGSKSWLFPWLCLCCNMALAFHLFSSSNALMSKENLHSCKRKCPKRSHY